jgi:ABC-type lipoprotein release transport system permease subunit
MTPATPGRQAARAAARPAGPAAVLARLRHLRLLQGLAFKNLTRHKRRSLITALALAMGLAMFILFDSLLTGLENDGVRSMVWYDTASLQIQQKDYWDEKDMMPLERSIAEPGRVIASLAELGLAACPRAVFGAELIISQDPWPQSGSVRVRVTAIDPRQDAAVFRLAGCLQEGRWVETGVEGVVLGSQLARDLGAKIGYPLTLVTRTRDGAYQTLALPVSGIVNSPNAAVNRLGAFLPLDLADAYLELGGSVNQIAVSAAEDADADALAASLEKRLAPIQGDLRVLPWRVTGADFLGFVTSRSGLSRIILLIVFIIAAVGVSNTMLLTILERTREMGMLRAQGLLDHELMLSLLMEAAQIGLLGGLLGLLLSLPFNLALINTGIDLTWVINHVSVDLPTNGRLRGAWHTSTMLAAVAAGIGLSVAVSILPVRRALRMEVTECLRHV